MSYRVFCKIQVSHEVARRADSFLKLVPALVGWALAVAANASRTLAGNAGYKWKTDEMKDQTWIRPTAKSGVCGRVDDSNLVWSGCDRYLRLNGRNRLSC